MKTNSKLHSKLREQRQRLLEDRRIAAQEASNAYDRRMLAGHAWDSHRKIWKQAASWLAAINKELDLLDHQIEKSAKAPNPHHANQGNLL